MSGVTTSPRVFAHRGSSAALPEHTLAAYLRALDEGADGLECDVRLSRDGHLVCVHDRRLDRTSNGRGRVSGYTLAQLDEFDFGSWHPGDQGADAWLVPDERPAGELVGGPVARGARDAADLVTGDAADQAVGGTTLLDGYGADGRAHTRLLTLERLLDAVHDAGRPVELLIETKHPTRYGPAVEHRLVEMLRRYGLTERRDDHPVRVTLMSFSLLAVRRMNALAPRVPTVLLLEMLPRWMRLGRLPFGARTAGPGVGLVRARPELVPALRARGHSVFVWTVNEPRDLDLVVGLGVDGVITDRPADVLRRLGR